MEGLLEEYLQMNVKGLPNLGGPRTPHILLDIVFPMDSPAVGQNRYLYKWKSLLSWLCERIFHIFLFIIILKKNSFWSGFRVERITALRLKANLEPCQTSMTEPLREKCQQVRAVTYFYKKLHHKSLTGF